MVSASALGAEGREFKSHNSDYFFFKGVVGLKKVFAAVFFAFLAVAQLAVANAAQHSRLFYEAYVADEGWLDTVDEGEIAGTVGESRRLEAIRISLDDGSGIEYSAHVQDEGWQNWKHDGQIAGTIDQGLRMEAIKIKLTGSYANLYDVQYRVHVEKEGWQGWVKNGAVAGTTGKGLRLEAIQIKLVSKSSNHRRHSYYDDDYDYDDDDYDDDDWNNHRRNGRHHY